MSETVVGSKGSWAIMVLAATCPAESLAQVPDCVPASVAARIDECPPGIPAPDLAAIDRARQALGRPRPESASLERRPLTDREVALLDLCRARLCSHLLTTDERVELEYFTARVYYEANHFAQASVLFRRVARQHPEAELAEHAAHLLLDSLNVLGRDRPACLESIGAEIPELSRIYCGGEGHEELCDTLGRLDCAVRRRQAERRSAAGDHRAAGEAYLRIASEVPTCDRMDEILHYAAIELDAARMRDRAITVRGRLVESFPASALAVRARFQIAAGRYSLAEYEAAADTWEDFARRHPGEVGDRCPAEDRSAGLCPDAPTALRWALFVRVALGQADRAIADAHAFERLYRARWPRETAELVLAAGTILESADDWQGAARHYEDWLRAHGGIARATLRLRAHAALGRALSKRGRTAEAEAVFRAALVLWDGQVAQQGAGDDERGVLDLADAREAAAEARFHLAEIARQALERLRLPAYRGGRRSDGLGEWIGGDLLRWREEANARLRAARVAYGRVIAMGLTGRTIAAAARVGEMARSMESALRSAPVPRALERDPALLETWRAAVTRDAENLHGDAVDAFRLCLETAVQTRWLGEDSARCARALDELDPHRRRPAEIRPEPHLVRQGPG